MALSRRSLLAGSFAAAAVNPIKLPRPLRVAIYGTEGHTGEITGQLARMPDITLTGVAGAATADVEKMAKRNNAPVYGSLDELLTRAKPDIIAITNDDGGRAGAILKSFQAGVDVIAEKPFALNYDDLNKIRHTQGKRKLGMLVPMRFEPPYLGMREAVKGGAIGEVAQIAAQKSYILGERAEWFKHRASYGGTIAWIGIHMFDLILYTTGLSFTQVSSVQSHIGFPEYGDMEMATASLFKMKNNAVGTLRLDYYRSPKEKTHGDDRLRLAGTKGIIEWDQAKGLTLMTQQEAARKLELPPAGSVFVDFLDHHYNGKPTAVPMNEIWAANNITLAAQQAADTNKIVQIPS